MYIYNFFQDICISAVKEKDIEAKLKQVIADWAVVDLTFGQFKNRGELLIKPQETLDLITLLEDSLMILNSLASNRLSYWFFSFTCSAMSFMGKHNTIKEDHQGMRNLFFSNIASCALLIRTFFMALL